MQTVNKAGIRGDQRLLEEVYKYFDTVTREKMTETDMKLSVAAGVDTSASILGKLIGLMSRVTGEIKLDSHSSETIVHTLRKRPADLLAQANRVIEAIQQELKAQGKRLLVVVEDIDKLDLKQAREMFVNNTTLLTGLATDIIYTIPIYLFHSPDLTVFKPRFDHAIGLPMIKVADPETGARPLDTRRSKRLSKSASRMA